MLLKKRIKSHLSRLNFFLGRNPIIDKVDNWKSYIPSPYKAVLLISADFELAWAWRYSKNVSNPLERAITKANIERRNLPRIIELCENYNIPVTWATVGHLFLDHCNDVNGKKHPEIIQIRKFENEFWKYDSSDWFEHDPGGTVIKHPEWYCPDLIKLILSSKTEHEVACHTFSHIDCSDHYCPSSVIESELNECIRISDLWELNFKSFVHPGYTIGNLELIAQKGFTNYRTNYRNVLGYPKKSKEGLWELEQTAEIIYRRDWSTRYHTFRYINILKRAIKHNSVCVLWFHPSFDPIILQEILPNFFKFLNMERDKVWITTHNEYINWLETSQ